MNPEPRKRLHPLIKVAIAIVALAGVGVLFVRSVQDARSEPYEIQAAHLASWTLAADEPDERSGAALSLRPPAELPANLFRQLFSRQMESLATPIAPGISLALRSEVAAGVSGEQLVALAKEAGLDRSRPSPRCIGYRRISGRGTTRQLYFVWFELPGYERFRQLLAPSGAPQYSAEGLSPVMLMAAEPGFDGWHPLVVDEAADCVAPVTVR